MHMQLAILCLFAVGMVTATGYVSKCSSAPCRKHLGVYYGTVEYAPNVTFNAVITYHADGTETGTNSAANGDPSATPPVGPFSSLSGIWKCDGADKIIGNGVFFFYRIPGFPGALATSTEKLKFDGTGGFSGTTTTYFYDLASTNNPNRSKWNQTGGPVEYKVKGYKLYDICDCCNS